MTTTTAPDDSRLDATFAALANSTRRTILTTLAHGDATVNELAEPFDMTLPAISRHIKVLEQAGLVTRSRRAQFRPCSIDASALADVADWADRFRHVWDDRFDRLDTYVSGLRDAHGTDRAPDAARSRTGRTDTAPKTPVRKNPAGKNPAGTNPRGTRAT